MTIIATLTRKNGKTQELRFDGYVLTEKIWNDIFSTFEIQYPETNYDASSKKYFSFDDRFYYGDDKSQTPVELEITDENGLEVEYKDRER